MHSLTFLHTNTFNRLKYYIIITEKLYHNHTDPVLHQSVVFIFLFFYQHSSSSLIHILHIGSLFIFLMLSLFFNIL